LEPLKPAAALPKRAIGFDHGGAVYQVHILQVHILLGQASVAQCSHRPFSQIRGRQSPRRLVTWVGVAKRRGWRVCSCGVPSAPGAARALLAPCLACTLSGVWCICASSAVAFTLARPPGAVLNRRVTWQNPTWTVYSATDERFGGSRLERSDSSMRTLSVRQPLGPDGWGGKGSADCTTPLPSVARTPGGIGERLLHLHGLPSRNRQRR
jgi:hypothetical protein